VDSTAGLDKVPSARLKIASPAGAAIDKTPTLRY